MKELFLITLLAVVGMQGADGGMTDREFKVLIAFAQHDGWQYRGVQYQVTDVKHEAGTDHNGPKTSVKESNPTDNRLFRVAGRTHSRRVRVTNDPTHAEN